MVRPRIRELIDWFIPIGVKIDPLDNAYMRARILIILLLLTTLGTLFAITFLLTSESFVSLSNISDAGIPAFALCAYLGCLAVLKFTQSIVVTVNLYTLTGYLTIVSAILLSGSYENFPAILLLIAIPIWIFLLIGRVWGLVWVSIFAVTITTYFIVVLHTDSASDMPLAASQVNSQYAVWILALVVISIGLFIYENHFEKINQTLVEQNRRFAHQAMHDPLTGLTNRRLFLIHAQQAIDFAISEDLKAAFIYIDLDEFKPVNDTHGHHVGDELLKIVAQRLKQTVRSSDTVARLGGDEFIVLLYGIKSDDTIGKLTQNIVESLHTPIQCNDLTLNIGASIGVVIAPNEGTNIEQIINKADKTMYAAKHSKQTVCYYNTTPQAELPA